MRQYPRSVIWGSSSKRLVLFWSGLAVVSTKLLLPPFWRVLPSTVLSTFSDYLLLLLLILATWQASLGSHRFARVLWYCFCAASVLWALNAGLGGLMNILGGFVASMAAFWRSTIIFYLAGIVLTVPLLLSEQDSERGFDWLRTFDILQLAIVTFCAYLVLFYIPIVTSPLEISRVREFMVMHWLRDGFLAVGFLYRAWRSRSRVYSSLLFKLAAFFVAYSATGSLEIYYYEKVAVWQLPLLDFVAALPALYLLFVATTWRPDAELAIPEGESAESSKLVWTHFLPVLLPVLAIVIATRVPGRYIRLAWAAVAASLACYAGRLAFMQRREERAQQELRALEEKFYKAFKISPAANTISRLSDGLYLDVSDRWLEMAKLQRHEVIGRTSVELGFWVNPEDRQKLAQQLRSKGSLRDVPVKFQVSGRIVDVLISAELIEISGEPLILTSTLDVSELRDATEQLRQAQKMDLVGKVAAGVAHDFNNLLTVIKGYAELARTHNLNGEATHAVDQISTAADKAAALTRQLLAFSRRQVLQPRNITLNAAIRGIEPMLRRMGGEATELVLVLDDQLGTVHADPAQMEQVLMNLAANARDAMPNGGTLRIATSNLDLPSAYPEREFDLASGNYVLLSVTDTGAGIPPEHMSRIFEPFFTTKEVGQGTGLGLSTVYGIIKQSGGYIWAYSEEGTGTTFKICLPRVDAPADTPATTTASTNVLGGTETVLLVEDDSNIRQLVAEVLDGYGYHVLVASSLEEALQLHQQYPGKFDLLLSDVVMPKGSGKELAARLKQTMPDLKVMFMSGYPYPKSRSAEDREMAEAFLPKPFGPVELGSKVREVLDRR